MSESDTGEAEAEAEAVVYHERQRLQLCLLHALNNLFQQKDAFTRPGLNAIAEQLVHMETQETLPSSLELGLGLGLVYKLRLKRFTPHHNPFTGNYDVNVLMAALDGHGPGPGPGPGSAKKKVLWHDHRTPSSSIDLAAPDLMGIMLNTTISRLRGMWISRHWLTLKNIHCVWYNLDSHLSAPHPFPDQHHLISFLDHSIAQGGEIFLVFNQD